jgi:hypothetical protein
LLGNRDSDGRGDRRSTHPEKLVQRFDNMVLFKNAVHDYAQTRNVLNLSKPDRLTPQLVNNRGRGFWAVHRFEYKRVS